METKDVAIMENVFDENDRIAEQIQEGLRARGIYAVNVMGAPGAGKTSCLIRLISHLSGVKPYVIEGDIESDIDTQKLSALGIETVQINTFGACHLDGAVIGNTLKAMPLDQKGVLFIENIGNLVCPAEFSIGENIKLLISTVTEGADKPYKYPLAFEKSAAILLNKKDLLPYVEFDYEYFLTGVMALNPGAKVFPVSAKTGEGFFEVAEWLKARL
ncbi:MAG TPA: hydrogenase nickel incorporation protein HypB [Feifaniaceae bacterium]|nr:hydrogenase nickel incorporation protein HypB [Feifaniaceae bacterium]